jgi:hypothetical protein
MILPEVETRRSCSRTSGHHHGSRTVRSSTPLLPSTCHDFTLGAAIGHLLIVLGCWRRGPRTASEWPTAGPKAWRHGRVANCPSLKIAYATSSTRQVRLTTGTVLRPTIPDNQSVLIRYSRPGTVPTAKRKLELFVVDKGRPWHGRSRGPSPGRAAYARFVTLQSTQPSARPLPTGERPRQRITVDFRLPRRPPSCRYGISAIPRPFSVALC